jgi:hypothetical protein
MLHFVKQPCVQFGKQVVHSVEGPDFASYVNKHKIGVVIIEDAHAHETQKEYVYNCTVIDAGSAGNL